MYPLLIPEWIFNHDLYGHARESQFLMFLPVKSSVEVYIYYIHLIVKLNDGKRHFA